MFSQDHDNTRNDQLARISRHRQMVEKLVPKLLHYDDKLAERLVNCGTFLMFTMKKGTDEMKLFRANFCKARVCPMCTWRRALKVRSQMERVLEILEPQQYSYLFLTLTVKNVHGRELKDTLDLLMKAWGKLRRRQDFKRSIRGAYRALEVTYNREDKTYHPHFHVVLAAPKSYFASRYYISQERWTRLWGDSLGVDYKPIVDVRAFKGDKKAIAEAAKYTVKFDDILAESDAVGGEVLAFLDKALYRRRLVSLTGVMKEAHKIARLPDIDADEEFAERLNTDKYDSVAYVWCSGFSAYKVQTSPSS